MAGIFGDTPAAVRQQMMAEQLGQANMIGNLGFGGRGALAGLQVGQGIGGILGAAEDPRVAQSQKLQQLEQEAAQAGLEPGTPEFTQWVVPRVTAAAGQQAGIQAFQMASQLEAQRSELEGIRGAPQAGQAQVERRVRALVGMGMDPQQAFSIAPNDDVYRDALKDLRKDSRPASVKEFEETQRNPAFGAWLDKQKELGASRSSVKIDNFFTKPLGKDAVNYRMRDGSLPAPNLTPDEAFAQGAVPISKEAQAASTARAKEEEANALAREKAGPILQEYIRLLQNKPDFTDPGALANWTVAVNQTKGAAGQALARLRNPERVTDDDVRSAERDLPGFKAAATGNLDQAIRSLNIETGVGVGGPAAGQGGQRRRRYNPQTGQFE